MFKAFSKQAVIIAFLGCLVANLCTAQTVTTGIISLPASFNRGMSQMGRDDEGFIWFSTNQGLWRYDGTDVKLFDYKKLLLAQNTTPNILYCYRHYIFFSQSNGELRIYNKVTGQCEQHKFSSFITNINEVPGGGLLFFTRNGEGWRFSMQGRLGKVYELATMAGWHKNFTLDKTNIDLQGNIYLLLHDRAGMLNRQGITWGNTIRQDTSKNKNVFSIVVSTTITSLYIAAHYSNSALVIYDKKTLAPLLQDAGHDIVYSIAIKDQLCMVARNSAQKKYLPSPFYQVLQNTPAELSKIYSSVSIKNTNRFLLSSSVGLLELKASYNENDAYENGLKWVSFFRNKSIRSIYRNGNDLYIGAYGGLYKCTADSAYLINPQVIYDIKKFDENTLMLAVEGGQGFILYNTLTGIFSDIPNPGRDHNYYITALYKDGDYWWCGDVNELLNLQKNGNTWSVKKVLHDDILNTVRQVKRIKGVLYVAAQNGLFKVDDKNHLKKIYPAKDSMRVYCMQEVSDGILLGTHGDGLVKIDSTGNVLQQIGFNEGLASNFVYSLTTLHNLLVAGTGSGASVFNIANGIQPVPVQSRDTLHGLLTQECNHSAIFCDTALQRVVLGGINGLLFVEGKEYGGNGALQNNRFILSYIKMGGHETTSSQANLFAYAADKITVRPEDVNVTLKFAAPGITGEAEGLFRITGLDDKWQRIKTNQEVNLYALPPGSYTLEARLPTSVNSKEWFIKTIVVQPAFYQTVLFKIVVGFCLLGIVYLLWRGKVKKIEKELRLRSMIASDLHDDIGSTLNSISVYTEVASQQLRTDASKTSILLNNMGIASRAMIDRMNDIVWAINPKNDDFEIVLERMQFFAAELLSGKNMLLRFEVDEKVKKLKFAMQERKNIYLIYKEAVNNAYKYSGGETVAVQVQKQGNYFELIITDNGNGFNNEKKSTGGNGLTNIRNRAKEIGGTLNIVSNATGAQVQLQLRLHNTFNRQLPKGVGNGKLNIRILQQWKKR